MNLFKRTGHWWPARPNIKIIISRIQTMSNCWDAIVSKIKNIYKSFETPDPKISTNVLTRASKQYKQSSQVQEFQR